LSVGANKSVAPVGFHSNPLSKLHPRLANNRFSFRQHVASNLPSPRILCDSFIRDVGKNVASFNWIVSIGCFATWLVGVSCTIVISRTGKHSPAFELRLRRQLEHITVQGRNDQTYRREIERLRRKENRHLSSLSRSLSLCGFHCTIVMAATFVALLYRTLSGNHLILSDLGILVAAIAAQSTLLWAYARLQPRSWIWENAGQLPLYERFGHMLRCVAMAEPSHCRLLHVLESTERDLGRSMTEEKLKALQALASDLWQHTRAQRMRWHSTRPIVEILAIGIGSLPVIGLLMDGRS
jgi:hypothetical protein